MNEPLAFSLSGSLGYEDELIIDESHFCLFKNRWHCLLGPSGAGKSTLLRLISQLQPPFFWFHGETRWYKDPHISMMTQQDGLLSHKNIGDNIAIGALLRGESIDIQKRDELLLKVGLLEDAYKRPSQLSGGMRQRTALARTLYEGSDIVLLDEPFSHLDSQTRFEIYKLTFSLLKNKTVLHITHDPREAALFSDYIYLLHHHKITEISTPSSSPLRQIDLPEVIACEKQILAFFEK